MDIQQRLVSLENPHGTLTNSDLEMAGLLMLWLVMEEVCIFQPADHVALFSDNSPTVHWVRRLASKRSRVAEHLVQALAMRLKKNRVSPLTPLHIAGRQNMMTDIPSRSFGSEPKWYCANNDELLTLFNDLFPLPAQQSWTVFQVSNKTFTRVLSVLRTEDFSLDEWRRLPPAGKLHGEIGKHTASLWEWTLSYRVPHTNKNAGSSWALLEQSGRDATADAAKSEVEQSLRRSRPLVRRFPWTSG
jgi:hypothetical protein